jgi:HD-like signal output (HDOD) protein
MISVAFIDDDQRVLDGLRRSMRKEVDLDCHFYLAGAELLDDFDKKFFDIVITDMRMPVMNGVDVLLAVKERNPSCIRIVLSGYSEDKLIIESLQAAHQYIAKPAALGKIKGCIERTIRVRDFLGNEDLRDSLSNIKSVPVLPEIYTKIMAEIASKNSSLDSIGAIVGKDIALTANILKLVNSAFFALVNHIESAQQGIGILGLDTIKNLAMSSSVFASKNASKQSQERIATLNRTGLEVGMLVSKLSKILTNIDTKITDEAEMAGMMLGIGELVLLHAVEQDSDTKLLRYGHEEVGSYLLGIWGLPFPLVEALRWHKNPSESGVTHISPLVIVHAAWAMHTLCSISGEVDLESGIIDDVYLINIVGENTLLEWKSIAQEMLA